MAEKLALLLVGSPRGKRSASQKLGHYLLEQLAARGWHTEQLYLRSMVRKPEKQQQLVAAVDRADVVILSAPLYVDTAPAFVIKSLEIIARQQDALTARRRQFLAISNCGFPESLHNEPAITVYRLFARQVGFDWAGGLMLGGGATIEARGLESLGGLARNVLRSLDLTAEALSEGRAAPEEALRLMAKPMMPNWLYLRAAEIGWLISARKHGTLGKLRARPYSQ